MIDSEKGSSIVLLGSFNPAIFQPAWIAQNSLLPEEEMDGFYNEQIIKKFPEYGFEIGTGQPFQVNNDQAVAVFRSFGLQVVRDRFITTVTTDHHATIRFIRKVFKILAETPIKAYGINFQTHLNFTNSYNEIINNLFDRKKQFIDTFKEEMTLGFSVKSKFNDFILTTTIEQSTSIKDGLFIGANFHCEIDGGARKFNEIDLKSQYSETEKYFSNSLINNLGTLKNRIK